MRIRVQRFLAEAGFGSRRACEDLVRQGRVTVAGKPAGLGATVEPGAERVMVDGETARLPKTRLYLAMHKPKGTITTAADTKGRTTVFSLLPDLPVRVHAVGRLDFNSEGLLLLTNDGLLTDALAHPSAAVEREYEVKVQGDFPEWAFARVLKGVRLEDGPARAARCERIDREEAERNTWLRVVMTEGRYREVRRMLKQIGFNVLKLKRVRFGPIRLGRIPPGAVRELKAEEVEALRAASRGGAVGASRRSERERIGTAGEARGAGRSERSLALRDATAGVPATSHGARDAPRSRRAMPSPPPGEDVTPIGAPPARDGARGRGAGRARPGRSSRPHRAAGGPPRPRRTRRA
ncbi:MAG: rRNA pseudouridine synthase [Deltaproteobacteria bacterium]|nr:rRNA pseudouridine synthase [Deltaproteobacteria bacterium]